MEAGATDKKHQYFAYILPVLNAMNRIAWRESWDDGIFKCTMS